MPAPLVSLGATFGGWACFGGGRVDYPLPQGRSFYLHTNCKPDARHVVEFSVMDTTLKKRLTWTQKDPRRALVKGWVQDPEFCWAYFDLCDDLALNQSRATLDLALHAVEFAETHGDPHLIHRAHGVLCHAFLARGDLYWAGKILHQIRDAALACCPPCRADFFNRQGYLLGEDRLAAESLEALNRALEEGGRQLSDDARARIYFGRSVAHHFLGNRRRALKDARGTLMGLSLDAPRGYYYDSGALIAVYIVGGDPEHDAYAEESFRLFSERIKGQKDWAEMHTRSAWAGTHLSARRGDFRGARRQIKRAWTQLRYNGLARELVAATLDRCQLICRGVEPRGDSPEVALELIKTCSQRPDLDDGLKERLQAMRSVLEVRPEHAFSELVDCRRSFIAPVPGAMAERIGAK